jgi:drug/metabolite transporter (DMT)-like permease
MPDDAPATPSAPPRRPKLGYLLAMTAATLWALNGSLAKFLLADHMPSARLAELRVLGTFAVIVIALTLTRPRLLVIRRGDTGRLALLGVVGLSGVTAFYFAAIARLDIGVALTIQYVGPVLLLVWLKLVHGRTLSRGLWSAAALALVGCFLVVRAYHPSGLNGIGVLAAVGAAVTFAMYLYASEQAGHRYAPATTLAWAFGFSAVFWLITQPVWSFPVHLLDTPRNLACAVYVVIGGTLLPFGCMFAAVRQLPASRAAVVATLEPVLGALLAWPIHGEALSPVQIGGGLIVVGAIIWVQSQRPQLEAELAPAYGSRRRRPGADPADRRSSLVE